MNPPRPPVDHLIYVVPDLEAALPAVEATFGVRPVLGGRHSEWGTWNALLSLGSDVYLEVVARDPVHAASATLFGVDRVRAPRLATWCARVEPLEDRATAAATAGLDVGPLLEGGRDRPDGTRVSWRISDPTGDREGGVLPFLIAWGTTPHPAGGVPGGIADGLTLENLSLEHPDPERIRRWLKVLELEVPVGEAPSPAMVVVLNTPLGEVLHRSDAPVFPLS
jgi:hypothetical protein